MRELLDLICSVEERESWTKNKRLHVWSNKFQRWVDGEILSLFSDEEGEWLEIGYENLSKQVQRYCEDICPVPEIVEERVRQKKKEKQGNYTNPRPERAFSETELENYLPDGESRKLWLDLTHGTKKSVDISHLIQSLGSEFNRITNVQNRALSPQDQTYLTTLLRSRFNVNSDNVTLQMFSDFWSQWYFPMCQTVRDIVEIWDELRPLLIHGLITKNRCEAKLRSSPPGTFLIRFSDSQGGCLSIVFNDGSRVRYILVQPLRKNKIFKICVGKAVKKTTLPTIILSLKRLKLLYDNPEGSHVDKEIFSKYDTRRRKDKFQSDEDTVTLKSLITDGTNSTVNEIPRVIYISGRTGLDGRYIQEPKWRGGRPTYRGPVHPQEGEAICLWYDDQRSEWTLSLSSLVASQHCLAFIQDSASDPTRIPPQSKWQIAAGVEQGWFDEELQIREYNVTKQR